jgi:benzodiazapine receptor
MNRVFNKLSKQIQDLPDKVAVEQWPEMPRVRVPEPNWQAFQPTRQDNSRESTIRLVVALAAPFLAAAIGAVVTNRSIKQGWYKQLDKPSWNPPSQLFGPVWTVLYLMMGVASWLVWQRGEKQQRSRWLNWFSRPSSSSIKSTLQLYGAQLGLNLLWSILFFGFRRTDLALANIVVLWSSILATMLRFYQVQPLAGWLLVPYQLWVTFATALNGAIWWLNRNKA